MSKVKRLSLDLKEEEHKKIKLAATHLDMSIVEFARQAFCRELSRYHEELASMQVSEVSSL